MQERDEDDREFEREPLDCDGYRIPDGACSPWSAESAAAFEEMLKAAKQTDHIWLDARQYTALRAGFAAVYPQEVRR